MSRRIALFASHMPGEAIAQYLSDCTGDEVVSLYVTGDDREIDNRIIDRFKGKEVKVFIGKESYSDRSHIGELQDLRVDTIICVYWPFILEKELFGIAKTTVNFHPALLPLNRGWYPHVHSIIDGTPCGVTLHELDVSADTGRIWVQRKVELRPEDTAKDIYLRLQEEIVDLFKANWDKISKGEIEPYQQDPNSGSYHKKAEVKALDKLDMLKATNAMEVINLLRARTFGDRGFAFYEEQGKRIYVSVRLSAESINDEC